MLFGFFCSKKTSTFSWTLVDEKFPNESQIAVFLYSVTITAFLLMYMILWMHLYITLKTTYVGHNALQFNQAIELKSINNKEIKCQITLNPSLYIRVCSQTGRKKIWIPCIDLKDSTVRQQLSRELSVECRCWDYHIIMTRSDHLRKY